MPLAQLAKLSDFLPEGFSDKGEAAVVADSFETFDDAAGWSNRELRLSHRPNCRFQFRDSTLGQMIQIQRTRFLFNWMGIGDDYPRFDAIFDAFQQRLADLRRFTEVSGVSDSFQVNQWEITYLNDIEKGDLWSTPEEWGFTKLFSPPSLPCGVFDSFSGSWHIVLKENRGRLHVDWEHLKREKSPGERQEVVRLNLTARGPATDVNSLLDGLRLGHSCIVCTFSELATDRASEHWKRDN